MRPHQASSSELPRLCVAPRRPPGRFVLARTRILRSDDHAWSSQGARRRRRVRRARVNAARAGVVNPDISVIGQPFVRWTDEAGSDARKRLVLDPGETEFLFDAALNPYARGTVVLSFGEEGASVEEGYFTLTRGPPANLAQGGQYRVGFGKLNAQHLHALPFADRFHVLGYLPGDEAFNETGVQLRAVRGPFERDTFSARRAPGRFVPAPARTSGASNDPLGGPEGGDHAASPRTACSGARRRSCRSTIVPLELGVPATQGHQQRRRRHDDHGLRRRREGGSSGARPTRTCCCRASSSR